MAGDFLTAYDTVPTITASGTGAATHPTDPQFVLVPREPTEEMCEAGWIDADSVTPRDIYKKMLSAAPAPTAQGEGLSLVRRFADELRKWWSFNEGQRHTHTWHSREDFIEKKLPELLAGEYAELTTIRAQADALASENERLKAKLTGVAPIVERIESTLRELRASYRGK